MGFPKTLSKREPMQIYISKNGEQLGPFSVLDVRQRLESGAITYGDLAWRDGLKTWIPLSEMMGGALPGATPHAVSTWDTPAPRVQGQTPTGLRIVTALVIFGIAFFVILIVSFFLACLVCGGIVGMQAAAAQHAQGFAQGQAVGREAGRQFGQAYAGIILGSSALFSLVVSAIIAWFMAFSNLFPWCRAR